MQSCYVYICGYHKQLYGDMYQNNPVLLQNEEHDASEALEILIKDRNY